MEIVGIVVALKNKPDVTGIMVREFVETKTITHADGKIEHKSTPVCVVAWRHQRSPALFYQHPSELLWLGFVTQDDLEDAASDEDSKGEEVEEDEEIEEVEVDEENAEVVGSVDSSN
jgi:hypothetical protein